MNVDRSDNRDETLGELILGLEPGKPCPWCGSGLEPSGSFQSVSRSRAGGSVESSDEPVLRCRSCGTEVCQSKTSAPLKQRGPLGAAA